MKIQPYNNVTIDLEKTSLITFYAQEDAPHHYTFVVNQDGNKMTFSAERIESVKAEIEIFNQKHGGKYWWPFHNIGVNLDRVSAVTLFDQRLVISHDGKKWVSSPDPDAVKIYKAYKSYIESVEQHKQHSKTVAADKSVQKKISSAPSDTAVQDSLETIDKMIGLDSAKHDIRQNIALARFNAAKADIGMDVKPISRHMVFTGNPGTGKTTFAREVAKVYHALGFLETDKVHEVKREDLVGEYTGQTAPKVKAALETARGGVLFIDEAYSLAREGAAFRDVFGTEAIDTLVAGMENMREDLVVIVAGYPEPMKKLISTNEGLKSRFTTYIHFDDYTKEQLGEIFDLMTRERGYTVESGARASVLSVLENEKADSILRHNPKSGLGPDFANGREVRNVVEQIEKAMALRLDDAGAFTVDMSAQADAASGDVRRVLLSTVTIDDVRGIRLCSLLSGSGKSRPVIAKRRDGPAAN